MKAFVINHVKEDQLPTWFYQVATNYTKLNFDYCMADRFEENADWHFFETTNLNYEHFIDYDMTIVVTAGVIFPYSYFQRVIEPQIGKFRWYNIGPDITIYNPSGTHDTTELELSYDFPVVDPSNADTFSATHDSAIDMVLKNSNLAYVVHNEIPKPVYGRITPIQWAMTVSSGFYINYILEDGGFTEDTIVNHIDISKSSIAVRKYTIANWDGEDYLSWLDHLYEKFPLLSTFNGKQFQRGHKPTHEVLDHMNEKWTHDEWITHWTKYKKCKHNFYVCNLSDHTALKQILDEHKAYDFSVFWYNGALKRQPANVNKTSQQSYTNVKRFMKTLESYNPKLLVYGSDHCCHTFNGTSTKAASIMLKDGGDSRAKLWKRV